MTMQVHIDETLLGRMNTWFSKREALPHEKDRRKWIEKRVASNADAATLLQMFIIHMRAYQKES
jgi:hypothetical protein